jgi:hypothetical protein
MLEDYADSATKQAALTTAAQKSELGHSRHFDGGPATSAQPDQRTFSTPVDMSQGANRRHKDGRKMKEAAN